MFEIKDGLSRMFWKEQVRFLEGKGAERLPTYSTIKVIYILRRLDSE